MVLTEPSLVGWECAPPSSTQEGSSPIGQCIGAPRRRFPRQREADPSHLGLSISLLLRSSSDLPRSGPLAFYLLSAS